MIDLCSPTNNWIFIATILSFDSVSIAFTTCRMVEKFVSSPFVWCLEDLLWPKLHVQSLHPMWIDFQVQAKNRTVDSLFALFLQIFFVKKRAVSTEHIRRRNTIELFDQNSWPLYWINGGGNSSRGSRINEIDSKINNILRTHQLIFHRKQTTAIFQLLRINSSH